ncbi:MAG TPA: polymer-forming cytoskeletal protein [Candidatus Aquilonibacter sp.]|nr:polymer-forming cytoskeletal protein [Candidatus Aquilonibacter sp.]
MLQPSDYTFSGKSNPATPNSNLNNQNKNISAPVEQATIGRTLVIKGELTAAEALYIDGRIEGKISLPDHRVTIGRNGSVQANINAREVVVMGKVNGNIECTDRVDIRSEGSVTGDVSTIRISVEDGAVLKGGVEVRSAEHKQQNKAQNQSKSIDTPKAVETAKPSASEPTKAMTAVAGA